jgi:hypothetical protein
MILSVLKWLWRKSYAARQFGLAQPGVAGSSNGGKLVDSCRRECRAVRLSGVGGGSE